jgi:hypothetical protein
LLVATLKVLDNQCQTWVGKKNLGRPKAKNRREVLRRAVSGLKSNFSDDECGHAPLSDNESV